MTIHSQTLLKVIDNSGAATIKVFNILRSKRLVGSLGSIVVGSVKEVRNLTEADENLKLTRVKKGEVVHGVVVRTRKEVRRKDGSFIKFDDNACVLVNIDPKKGITPKGTRINGVIAQEVGEKGMSKVRMFVVIIILDIIFSTRCCLIDNFSRVTVEKTLL